jgi:D-3-phosphoglycerate dehydrogenase
LQVIDEAGGVVVPLEEAEVLVWQTNSANGLAETVAAAPGLRWVQLTSAGVDWLLGSEVEPTGIIWTCAKGGAMGENAAEHALLLVLAAARQLHSFVRARTWTGEAGRRLAGSRVGIIGGGGIGRSLATFLQPLGVDVAVVRRSSSPVEGAQRVVGPDSLDSVLEWSDFVVLATPLTRETRGFMDRRRLSLFKDDAWLVNVARGALVCTDDLVAALHAGDLGGAALDVVDPEPLPADHPLWQMSNVILTPHVASTREMAPHAVAAVLAENMQRWVRGLPLAGVVDPDRGY